ncbi:hypothetical protein LRP52_47340 [Photobacterium sp. ZSDE20]|uniref:Uncharacterized protein n=1 Tax=Photobacterium pectinilyticum TaxID=2906793 RepID=A0ABT1N3L6_9GAMM|nr:hypothetical protein [Photobacterium sp. ZSDE20]MCQ1059314.1 hypothetical protein [Photobacterium sp. ZSDE20]MDD1829770.1 hypothetical protein [Photobacterium sp. ZSDE20]
MTLSHATLVIPAHMLPGGIAPIAHEFGFEHVEKQRLEHGDAITLTQFAFNSPLTEHNELDADKTFDSAAKYFLWHLAKGTPYQITKSFSDGSQSIKSYLYRNNRLTSHASPLEELLANSQ